MIERLRRLLSGGSTAEEPAASDRMHLAIAVLLVEIARADHEHTAEEDAEILRLLEGNLRLAPPAALDLLAAAKHTAEHSVSLHDFTRTVHEQMTYDEKQEVIEMLWRIALTDRSLDKYEDYLIGKIAELLYVSRGDVIRLKHRVTDVATSRDDF
jgi:uncharacterized tellurite resistance protein B-like protein